MGHDHRPAGRQRPVVVVHPARPVAVGYFVAGRSPVVAMTMVRIDQAKAEGKLGSKPALEMALAFVAFGQGLVSMHRARRFSSDKQFRALFHTAQQHLLDSYKPSGSK